MVSNPEDSMLSPTKNSISPTSKKQKILSDKGGEQHGDDGHSSERASQIVLYKDGKSDRGQNEQGENHFSLVPSKPQNRRSSHIGAFAAQCATCGKWRFVPTKEKYEELRERSKEDPFKCEKAREWKPDVTCDDPEDVSQDGNRRWAIDKHDIPQAPPGWERLITIRGEGSTKFADVYYISPTGRKLRSNIEVKNYLEENPGYAAQGVKLSQFSFKTPGPLQQDYVKKRTQTSRKDGMQTSRKDGMHTGPTKPLPEEVQPLAWAAPQTHDDPGDKQLVLYNEDHLELLQQQPGQPEMRPGSPPPPSAV